MTEQYLFLTTSNNRFTSSQIFHEKWYMLALCLPSLLLHLRSHWVSGRSSYSKEKLISGSLQSLLWVWEGYILPEGWELQRSWLTHQFSFEGLTLSLGLFQGIISSSQETLLPCPHTHALMPLAYLLLEILWTHRIFWIENESWFDTYWISQVCCGSEWTRGFQETLELPWG